MKASKYIQDMEETPKCFSTSILLRVVKEFHLHKIKADLSQLEGEQTFRSVLRPANKGDRSSARFYLINSSFKPIKEIEVEVHKRTYPYLKNK